MLNPRFNVPTWGRLSSVPAPPASPPVRQGENASPCPQRTNTLTQSASTVNQLAMRTTVGSSASASSSLIVPSRMRVSPSASSLWRDAAAHQIRCARW